MNLRDWLYLAAIAVVVAGALTLRTHLIHEGENAVRAQDAKAIDERRQAIKDQQEVDNQSAGETISELRQKLTALAADRGAPANPLRLCRPAPDITSPLRVPSSTADRAQPGELARPADDQGLLGRDQPGPDVSADVRALKDAGLILATYRQLTVDWALKQAHPPH